MEGARSGAKAAESYVIPEDDGWTLAGYLAASPPLHGELRFTYRPLSVTERSYLVSKVDRITGDRERAKLFAETLANRIKSWSLANEITDKVMLSLRSPIWDRLVSIVIYQTEAGDSDPEWTEEDGQLHADAELDAALTGKGVGDAKQEILEKN